MTDIVADLNGQIHIVLVGFIDSYKGRIRITFANVPDAPVSRFVLRMKGGKKGLLVNSTNLCVGKHRVTVDFKGQNGKAHDSNPLVKAKCGGKR